MSLRTRIAAVAGLAVAIALVTGTAVAYVAIRSELRGQVDRNLHERVGPLREGRLGPGFGRPGRGGGPPPFDGLRAPGPVERFGGAAGVAQLVLADGTIVHPRGGPEDVTLPVADADLQIAGAQDGERLADTHVDGTHLRVLTVGVPGLGAVQVARPLNEVDRDLRRILIILLVVAAGGIAAAAALGFAVARAALAPIARFTRGTEEVTGQLAHMPLEALRLDVTGTDELGRLATSFNATLDALERSAAAQRQLVADASHELRTPLASLRANIQVLEDADRLPASERAALRADVVSELDELTALVGDVVELARGARPDAELDDVRLDEIVVANVERARRRAGDAVAFTADTEPTVVRGEGERIARAVSNLLDNARKWSPPGSVVEVTLRDGTLSVRDHGPGFAEEDLPRVFERFYRAAAARGMPGSGLGLAIVRQAAEEHGGSVAAANAPGGGALVRARFGTASAPDAT